MIKGGIEPARQDYLINQSIEFNNIVVDFNSKMCKYISFGYFFDGDEVARSHYNYAEKIRSPMMP